MHLACLAALAGAADPPPTPSTPSAPAAEPAPAPPASTPPSVGDLLGIPQVQGEGDDVSEEVMIDKLISFQAGTRPDRALRLVLGGYGVVVVPNHELGISAVPRFEVAIRLPWREGAVVPFVQGAYGVAAGSGAGTEPQRYAYQVGVHTAQLALGATLRLTEMPEAVNPEIGIAPTLFSSTTVVEAEIHNAEAGAAVDTTLQPGLLALVGLSIEAGPGVVMLLATGDGRRVQGDLTGGATLMQYGISLGYRLDLRLGRPEKQAAVAPVATDPNPNEEPS